MSEPIYVTKPGMPPLAEFVESLERVWDNGQLTNGGPFHQQLEDELCRYLGVDYISLFSSGTSALITALQGLELSGEVITTPYSFVATSHALHWNNLTPVFVDVEPGSFNLCAKAIEAAITPETVAILAVHCYGYPCDVEAIESIATRHGLKVVYDAAHAFGVSKQGQSLLNFGDLSVLSFHATKVFSTFEGGAVICHDAATKEKIDRLKNFGFVDSVSVGYPGGNGKLNEVSAAFGLLQLKYIDDFIARRKKVDEVYRAGLSQLEGILCVGEPSSSHNFSYFPIVVTDEFPLSRDALVAQLEEQGIVARRYFYPLIPDFKLYPKSRCENVAVARDASNRVLCLPIYPDLEGSDQSRVVEVISAVARGRV